MGKLLESLKTAVTNFNKKRMIIPFFVTTFLCLFHPITESSNLVINGGFEVNQISAKSTIEDWTYLEDFGEINWYVRYSANCSDSVFCQNAPSNNAGFQLPVDGDSYAGIGFYSPYSEQKEYLVGSLAKSLIQGASYSVSFYINLADCSGYSINSFGAALISEQEVFKLRKRKYKPITSVSLAISENFNTANDVDTVNWKKIEGTIIAKGGEQKILIGCFKKDSDLIINKKRVSKSCKSKDETITIAGFYLIDNVVVKEL